MELSTVVKKWAMPTLTCAVTVNVVARKRETDTIGEWHHLMNCHE
jgi:hypothetical protein